MACIRSAPDRECRGHDYAVVFVSKQNVTMAARKIQHGILREDLHVPWSDLSWPSIRPMHRCDARHAMTPRQPGTHAMKITGIKAWQVDLPLREGRYAWSNDNAVAVFDSTVVAVETDAGVTGYGECTPLGSACGAGSEADWVRSDRPWRAQPAHGRGTARAPVREGAA
jgi:hypothetical protein